MLSDFIGETPYFKRIIQLQNSENPVFSQMHLAEHDWSKQRKEKIKEKKRNRLAESLLQPQTDRETDR